MITKLRLSLVVLAALGGCSSGSADPPAPTGGGDPTLPGSTGGNGSPSPGGTGGATAGTTGGVTAGGTGGATGGATGGSTGGLTAERACADSARVICERFTACAPFGRTTLYGDEAACRDRVLAGCLATLAAPDAATTAEDTAACTAALPSVACGDFVAQRLGAACAPKAGSRADRAPCAYDSQCQSAFCARAPGASCGVCGAPTRAGDACVAGACSPGLVCSSAGRCVALGNGKAGDACQEQTDCDNAAGFGCNPLARRCIELGSAKAGDGCGSAQGGGGRFLVCEASGTCSGATSGTCAAAAKDGEACSDGAAGPRCLAPAVCKAGRCAVPSGVCP